MTSQRHLRHLSVNSILIKLSLPNERTAILYFLAYYFMANTSPLTFLPISQQRRIRNQTLRAQAESSERRDNSDNQLKTLKQQQCMLHLVLRLSEEDREAIKLQLEKEVANAILNLYEQITRRL